MSKRAPNQTTQSSTSPFASTPTQQKIFPPIDNLQQFRQCLVMTLAKYGDPLTVKQAQDEVQELMTEHITNTDRMNAFLFMLSEHNDHMKPHHRKDLIKLYGTAAEIFEEALVPFMPKVLTYLQRKLKENDATLHQPIADALGQLVHHVLKKLEALDDVLREFNPILKMIFTLMASPNKQLQTGAAMCLTKVIQNAPVVVLQATLSYITSKLLESLQGSACKAQTQLLESLISLILAVETDFHSPLATQFLPILLECLTLPEWTIRKMAIDVLYTMAAILKDTLAPYKQEILEVLQTARTDKIRPVREASIEAIQAIRDIPSDQDDASSSNDNALSKGGMGTSKSHSKIPTFNRKPPSSAAQRDNSGGGDRSSRAVERDQSPQQQIPRNRPQTSTNSRKKNTSQTRQSAVVKSQVLSQKGHSSNRDLDGDQLKKNLTSATQKRVQRQQMQETSQIERRKFGNSVQGECKIQSIFASQRNNKFFNNRPSNNENGDIEILEGPPVRQTQESQERRVGDDIPIQIYESKKQAPYQMNDRTLEELMQSSGKKSQVMNSSKKVSPIKKNFLEEHSKEDSQMGSHSRQNMMIQEEAEQQQNQDSLSKDDIDVSIHRVNGDRSFQSPQSQGRQQPKQQKVSLQVPVTQSQAEVLWPSQHQQQLQQTQPQFILQPQFASSVEYTQQQQPQVIVAAPQHEQQMNFLMSELQKIHQNQLQIMERLNDFQSSQKQEMFGLSSRIAKVEDYIALQQLKSTTTTSSVIQPIQVAQVQQQVRPKWGATTQGKKEPSGLWAQVMEKIEKGQINEGYGIILSNEDQALNLSEDRDLLLIKLIGKTGVCLDQIDPYNLDMLLNRIISILSKREFIEVLLPWLAAITKYMSGPKDQTDKTHHKLNLNTLSNLIECLLLLLNSDDSNAKNCLQINNGYLSEGESGDEGETYAMQNLMKDFPTLAVDVSQAYGQMKPESGLKTRSQLGKGSSLGQQLQSSNNPYSDTSKAKITQGEPESEAENSFGFYQESLRHDKFQSRTNHYEDDDLKQVVGAMRQSLDQAMLIDNIREAKSQASDQYHTVNEVTALETSQILGSYQQYTKHLAKVGQSQQTLPSSQNHIKGGGDIKLPVIKSSKNAHNSQHIQSLKTTDRNTVAGKSPSIVSLRSHNLLIVENEHGALNQSMIKPSTNHSLMMHDIKSGKQRLQQIINRKHQLNNSTVDYRQMHMEQRVKTQNAIQSQATFKTIQEQKMHKSKSNQPFRSGVKATLNQSVTSKAGTDFWDDTSDQAVNLLQQANSKLRESIYQLIGDLEGKIMRANQRREEKVQREDPLLGKFENKIKRMTKKKHKIQKEITVINDLLDEQYDIENIVTLENDFKDKQKQLSDLQLHYETVKQVTIRQDQTITEEQSHIDQTANRKKLIAKQAEGLKKELAKLKQQERSVQQVVKEQHGQIMAQEDKSKKLMGLVKEAKSGGSTQYRSEDFEQLEGKIIASKQELSELLQLKNSRQRAFEAQLEDLQQKIQNTHFEIKVSDLQLRDRDHQVRLLGLRQKEIEKQGDEYRKLKRLQKQKESKQALMMQIVPQIALNQIMVKDEAGVSDEDDHRSQISSIHSIQVVKQEELEDEGNFFNLTKVDTNEYDQEKSRQETFHLMKELNQNSNKQVQIESFKPLKIDQNLGKQQKPSPKKGGARYDSRSAATFSEIGQNSHGMQSQQLTTLQGSLESTKITIHQGKQQREKKQAKNYGIVHKGNQ